MKSSMISSSFFFVAFLVTSSAASSKGKDDSNGGKLRRSRTVLKNKAKARNDRLDPQMYLGLQPERELSSFSLSSVEEIVEETSKQKSKTSTSSSSKAGKAAGTKCLLTETPPVEGTLIEVGSITSGTTVGGLDPGQISFPLCGSASFTSPSTFYRVVGTGNWLTASTCNDGDDATGSAEYDTKISVFSSCGFQCVDGNDDGAGCTGFSSRVGWQSVAFEEYTVIVHGFGGGNGNFELSVFEQ